jgi:DNA replication and repair protein RecF
MQLDMYSRLVYEKRQRLVDELIPIFNEYYQTICQSSEQVGLRYVSQLAEGELTELLAKNRERDYVLGYTSTGIHKDDLEMTLNGSLIRRIGSQGQNKTYLIALKLSQFAFLNREGRTTPILLLDDIFDKLDANRVEQIIKLVSGDTFGQIFITDTNRKYLDEILSAMKHDYTLFHVENGTIQTM